MAKKWLRKFLAWRIKYISDKAFIIFLSIIVGVATGFAAVLIKNSVHLIQSLVHNYQGSQFLYFVFPLLGIILVYIFIRFILKKPIRHGVPNVLYGIKNNGYIPSHNVFSSVIASALTVGFGGSVGLEGPTVSTGAAIGSNIGRLLRLNYKHVILLLGCASAGAMSAIFKAPIAAIVFALEVIMLDLTLSSLLPLLMASSAAVITSYLFLGQEVLYKFHVESTFDISELVFYILFGVLAGFISVYFTRIYVYIGNVFERFKNQFHKMLIGGVILGLLVFIFPALYGEGYYEINASLSGDYSYIFENSFFESYKDSIIAAFVFLSLVILLKVVAATLTFSSGGVGGIFAPTLFMGANAGLLFSVLINHLGIKELPVKNFALIGMAGLISGVLHAPLTAIFLIGEITNGYALFLPLMITSTISFAVVRIFEHNSVYTIQLAKRGELITHHKDKAALKRMNVRDLIETNFNTIGPEASLGDLVKVISKSQRNIFPVVDEKQTLYGIVFVNDIRHIVFRPELYNSLFVRDLMFMPTPEVHPDEEMETVAKKFQTTSHYNLPVIENGKYLGFVSRANVFSSYRELIRDFSED